MIEKLFPAHQHLALKFLATKPWLTIKSDPIEGTLGNINTDLLIDAEDLKRFSKSDIAEARRLLKMYASTGSSAAFFTHQVSVAIATGPKIFKPTFDQCLGLENVDVTVPFENYKQPFPVVIIETPKEYREHIIKKYGVVHAPVYVIAHLKEPDHVISVSAWFGPDNLIVNIMGPKASYRFIEDAFVANREKTKTTLPDFDKLRENFGEYGAEIKKVEDAAKELAEEWNSGDFGVAELVQRLGINFSMMMTTLGTSVVGPTNTTPERFAKNSKVASSGKSSEQEKERAKRLLAGVTFQVKLNQEISFFQQETEKVKGERGQPTGKILQPHWRRGYWRLQWHGTGNSLFKYVFIEGVRVNKELDTVDLSETSVTYTGERK